MVRRIADKLESLLSATTYAEEGDFVAARSFANLKKRRKKGKTARRLSGKWEDAMAAVAFAEEGIPETREGAGAGGKRGPSSLRKGRARRKAAVHAISSAKA